MKRLLLLVTLLGVLLAACAPAASDTVPAEAPASAGDAEVLIYSSPS